MKSHAYSLDWDWELPEFSDEELAQFRPIEEVVSPEFMAMLLANQEKQAKLGKAPFPTKSKQPQKEMVYLALSPEILQAFQATGKDWQNRINNVLLDYVQNHLSSAHK